MHGAEDTFVHLDRLLAKISVLCRVESGAAFVDQHWFGRAVVLDGDLVSSHPIGSKSPSKQRAKKMLCEMTITCLVVQAGNDEVHAIIHMNTEAVWSPCPEVLDPIYNDEDRLQRRTRTPESNKTKVAAKW